MRHVIIASHHRFAEGLADTLEFLGVHDKLNVINAYVDDDPVSPHSPDELTAQVKALIENAGEDDQVLVFTDVMGGSVNREIIPFASDRVFVVAGVNVALAVELCISPCELSSAGIETAIENARANMCLVNSMLSAEDDEDDE